MGPCSEHSAADPLRDPCPAGQRGDRCHRHPAHLSGGERARRVEVLSPLPSLPSCAVQHPPSARTHLPGRGASPGLGQGPKGAAALDESGGRAGPDPRRQATGGRRAPHVHQPLRAVAGQRTCPQSPPPPLPPPTNPPPTPDPTPPPQST